MIEILFLFSLDIRHLLLLIHHDSHCSLLTSHYQHVRVRTEKEEIAMKKEGLVEHAFVAMQKSEE